VKRYAPTILRVVLGLMFTGSAIAGVLGKAPPPASEAAQAFMGTLASSGLIHLVKAVELACGLALLSGFFVPLALVVLAPILVNILFFHAALEPAGLIVSVALTALWMGNVIANRATLFPLLQPRPQVA
jgi:putative oxidoreductase